MPTYRVVFQLSPPGAFGLPDGAAIVVPARKGSKIEGPIVDTRSGNIVGHPTLPAYRAESEALSIALQVGPIKFVLRDNFLTASIDAENDRAFERPVLTAVELFIQALGVQHGHRFSALFLQAEDSTGRQLALSESLSVEIKFQFTTYNIQEISERATTAANWVNCADERMKKALFYFDHSCLLDEFAGTLPMGDRHASLSRSMAFLQLFKAITAILGDPSRDRDYQRRARQIGLERDFWAKRAKPLYRIRNDEDVAHYTNKFPEMGDYISHSERAKALLLDVLRSYSSYLDRDNSRN